MRLHEPDGDYDHLHSTDLDVTEIRVLDDQQAEVARILGWTRRLNSAQMRAVTELADLIGGNGGDEDQEALDCA